LQEWIETVGKKIDTLPSERLGLQGRGVTPCGIKTEIFAKLRRDIVDVESGRFTEDEFKRSVEAHCREVKPRLVDIFRDKKRE
jgi:hypothetical protein